MNIKHTGTPLTEDFIEKLLHSEKTRDNQRAMIIAAWEAGVESQHTGELSSSVANFATNGSCLMQKIERVRQVIRNTVNKSKFPAPDEFKWVMGRESYFIESFQRNIGTEWNHRWHDIQNNIIAGETDFAKTDSILLRGAGHYNRNVVVKFPAAWFSLSDGDLSKITRRKMKEQFEKSERDVLKDLKERKQSLETQLAAVLSKIDKIG